MSEKFKALNQVVRELKEIKKRYERENRLVKRKIYVFTEGVYFGYTAKGESRSKDGNESPDPRFIRRDRKV